MSDLLLDLLSSLTERDRQVGVGETLFRAGDPVRSVFVVISGELRLIRTLPHGSELTLQRAGAGALLAEASLFAPRYHCDAKASEDSVLRVVPIQRVKMALGEGPGLATALTRHLAQELHRARTQAEILSLKTVAERVDAWMTLHNGILPPRGNWRQIASEIGVTPEALYRELARRR